MNKRSSRYRGLLRNILLLFTGTFVSKVLSFFMVPFYTSILTTEDYGVADLITTTVLLLLPFFSLLMDEAVMRFTLDSSLDRKQVLSIAFTLSSLGYALLMCISPFVLFIKELRPFYWLIILYYVVSWVYNIVVGYVRGLNRLSLTTIAGVIHTFSYLGLNIIFLAILKIGIHGYLLAMSLSNLISIIFLICANKLWKSFVTPSKLNWNLAKKMVKYSAPMIPNYISWWFCNCSDRYMVAFFCGSAVTGIYSVAYKIPTILSSMTSIFSSAWRISSVDDFGSEESLSFFNRTYKLYSGMLLIGASALILATKLLASILYAKDFFVAWRITPFLILAYTISALANFVESIFNASKQTRTLFIASMTGGVANIVLNYVLIPRYAGTGAAIATAVSYAIILSIDMVNTRKILRMNFGLVRILPSYLLLSVEIFMIQRETVEGAFLAIICAALVCMLNMKELFQIVKMLGIKMFKIVGRTPNDKGLNSWR